MNRADRHELAVHTQADSPCVLHMFSWILSQVSCLFLYNQRAIICLLIASLLKAHVSFPSSKELESYFVLVERAFRFRWSFTVFVFICRDSRCLAGWISQSQFFAAYRGYCFCVLITILKFWLSVTSFHTHAHVYI